MKIKEIYQKYNIPPNLQEHLLLVTSIANYICTHWENNNIDKSLVVKLSLLHDIGNIVKFDFASHPEFLGNEQVNIEYWKNKQKETIEKYGKDDHEVTNKILTELGIEDKLIHIVLNKSFSNSLEIANSNDWTLKILAYSDFRVSPNGIDTLKNRLSEVMNRLPKYNGRNDLFEAAKNIKNQIQENVNFPLNLITNKNINNTSEEIEFLETEININVK